MTTTAQDVERTARDTTTAQWGVAAVVMTGSMAAGGFAFRYLGEPWPLGVLIALAVDLALAAWLRIESRLRAHGVRSGWGRLLEVVTAVMTLYLNLGAAVFRGIDKDSGTARALLGIAHGFLPVVLVLFTIAGGQAQRRLAKVKRDREGQVQAEREAQLADERAQWEAQQRQRQEIERRRANGELVDATDILRKARELREQAEREATEATSLRELAQQERATAEAETAATKAAAEKLARRQRPAGASARHGGKSTATAEERRQWVREQRAELGRSPAPAEVDKHFGGPRTGYRIVAQVEQEIEAELATLTGGPS